MIKTDPLLKTFVSLQSMKELRRQGAIFYGERMMEADTIAGHSFTVTCLAWFITARLKKKVPSSNVDVQRVLEMGLCHDMGEAITGDIPAPFKRKAKELGMGDTLEKAELEAFKDLVAPLEDLRMDLPAVLKEFDQMDSKEAAIVRVADRLDAYVHALATQSVHHVIQAWAFYNSNLHEKLEEKAKKTKSNDKAFWRSLADWFKNACDFLGSADGLCPTIPENERTPPANDRWLPKWAKRK